MDLCAGEIALYSYLMRMEDRETYSCYPSFKTIGKHTSVITQAGIKRNGNLKYQLLPIKNAVDEFHQKQILNGGINNKVEK